MVTQLPLNIHLKDDAIFDNYIVGDNQQLLHHLQQLFLSNPLEKYIYCYGEQGVGRSHLLQACCHAATEHHKSVFYLPLSSTEPLIPAVLDDLEQFSLVCIDDIDAVMGNSDWEEALFHFYNRMRDQQSFLLISAAMPPKQLPCQLPDLKTRLSNGLVLEVHDLNDHHKMRALQVRAANRGMTLSEEVCQFLLRRHSRNMRDLFTALDQLDHASLVAKRKITIPFVKTILDNPDRAQ